MFGTLVREVKGAVILSSSISTSEVYNDNLFFTETDRQADFTTIISPALSLAYTSKNVSLTVGYGGSAQFHAEHPEADGYFQSLSFDLDLPILNRQIRGLEISVTEEVSYSPELPAFSFNKKDEEDTDGRVNQVFLGGEGVQQSGRVDTFQNRAGILLRYPWSQNFSMTASYINVVTRYKGSTLQDTVLNNGAINGIYRYQASSRTDWIGKYGVSATFDGNKDLFHETSLGVQHKLSRFVSASGNFGVSFVQGESSPQIILGAGISKRYKTGSLNLQYSNKVANGLGVIQGITRRQGFVGSATQTLGKKVASSVQLGYASNKSFSGNAVDVSAYTAGAGLSIRLLSWLSGSVNYAYLNQQSKGRLGEDGERNVVSLTFTAAGPSWRMIK